MLSNSSASTQREDSNKGTLGDPTYRKQVDRSHSQYIAGCHLAAMFYEDPGTLQVFRIASRHVQWSSPVEVCEGMV